MDTREYTLDQVHIPRMYFQEQSADFDNKRNYLSEEFKRLSIPEEEQEELSKNAGPAPKITTAKRTVVEPTRDPSKRLRNA